MIQDIKHIDRGYRRGAIMGLTVAEAFILIAFLLLLLFAFWQWEIQREKEESSADVQTFMQLPREQREMVLKSIDDGSMVAFFILRERGVEIDALMRFDGPAEKWRFIDKDEEERILEAVADLPEDVQRDLADLVEADTVLPALEQMAALQELVKAGQSIDLLKERIRHLEKLAAEQEDTAAQRALQGIEGRIRAEQEREQALTGALETELGELVARVGGQIDESGAIILPDSALFERGEADITPQLRRFLAEACNPWLAVLKESGVPISEIKIEGHASSEWRSDSSPRGAYLGNLGLSQRRSQAVLRECLGYVRDLEMLEWARRHLIAVGYSSVRPVMRDGKEDLAASRRVVFSVAPSRDALIRAIEDQIR